MIDDRDAIAKLVGFVHVMRRDEDGEIALGLDALKHFPDMHARHRVEARRRLVEKKDAGLVDEAARDFNTAPHAARQISDLLMAPLRQLDRFQQIVDVFFRLSAALVQTWQK